MKDKILMFAEFMCFICGVFLYAMSMCGMVGDENPVTWAIIFVSLTVMGLFGPAIMESIRMYIQYPRRGATRIK